MEHEKLAQLDLSALDRAELDALSHWMDNAWSMTHEQLPEGVAGEIHHEIEDIEADISYAKIELMEKNW